MKIVKLKGGLGNQMFQYAFAKLLKKRTGDAVKIDDHYFSGISANDSIRKIRLYKLRLSLDKVTEQERNHICKFIKPGVPESWDYKLRLMIENLLNSNYFFEKNRAYINPDIISHYSYFDGYWQSWRYVDEVIAELKKEFSPKYNMDSRTKKMIENVRNENSVFVGVRKGDYASSPKHFGAFGNEYYDRALDYISQKIPKPVFYVFSNDIEWVVKNMELQKWNAKFRMDEDIVDDFEDFMIMANCKHSVIINSTYHWWAARLYDNEDKIVVAPRKWFFDDSPIDIIPPNWVRM